MRIFTIGFTKTSAENFFERLRNSGVKRIIDTRLNNTSQLSGFAKGSDLDFFLKSLCNIEYIQNLDFTPTKEMLSQYRKKEISWDDYEKQFYKLIQNREIESINKNLLEDACLLCSEDKPHHCHRRLVAEYLEKNWSSVEIIHL